MKNKKIIFLVMCLLMIIFFMSATPAVNATVESFKPAVTSQSSANVQFVFTKAGDATTVNNTTGTLPILDTLEYVNPGETCEIRVYLQNSASYGAYNGTMANVTIPLSFDSSLFTITNFAYGSAYSSLDLEPQLYPSATADFKAHIAKVGTVANTSVINTDGKAVLSWDPAWNTIYSDTKYPIINTSNINANHIYTITIKVSDTITSGTSLNLAERLTVAGDDYNWANHGNYSYTWVTTNIMYAPVQASLNLQINNPIVRTSTSTYNASGKLIGGTPGGQTVSYTISGTPGTTTTASDGSYSITGITAGSTIVITAPSQIGYNVNSASKTITGISADSTDNDFTYTANSYTITYNNLNGANNSNFVSYTYGNEFTLANPGTLTGYTFTGWYDAETGGNQVTEISNIYTGNKTLYAQWKINSYIGTYDSNGGSSVDNQEIEHGQTATKPANPEKSGYTFAGWYTAEGLDWDFDSAITSDITLYAKWIENSDLTNSTNQDNNIAYSTNQNNPKTGDNTNIELWISIFFISLALIVYLLIKRYKKAHSTTKK